MTNITTLSLKGMNNPDVFITELTRLVKDNIHAEWNKNTLTLALWYYFIKNVNNKSFLKELQETYEKEKERH